MIFSLLPVPQSLWAGPGCRRAGNLLGLIRGNVHVGQAGLDEEQMRRLVPAGIPGARIVEGYAHVVQAPGESAVTDLSFKATGGADDLDIGAQPNRFVQLYTRAGRGNVLQIGNSLLHGPILKGAQDV